MSTVVHFEIPADDIRRAKDFYTKLFGWGIEEIKGMDYWMITTSGECPVNGGIMKRQSPQQGITNYVDVSSVADHTLQVEKLGGKIIVPKTAVPGMGYFVVCLDTENNPFGLWEGNKDAK